MLDDGPGASLGFRTHWGQVWAQAADLLLGAMGPGSAGSAGHPLEVGAPAEVAITCWGPAG